ncbi:MAG: hypothetical protein KJ702_05805, partial [Gammaproteobacteria bacterium]|nr:hypothetical protein [Gammaproteobacteria bacterium]
MKPRLPTRDEPQRQFTFISEGRLQAAPTVRHLLKFLEPVSPDDFCQVVLERFLDDTALYALPVVDAVARPLFLL